MSTNRVQFSENKSWNVADYDEECVNLRKSGANIIITFIILINLHRVHSSYLTFYLISRWATRPRPINPMCFKPSMGPTQHLFVTKTFSLEQINYSDYRAICWITSFSIPTLTFTGRCDDHHQHEIIRLSLVSMKWTKNATTNQMKRRHHILHR